jgi:hypothetical protein
MAQNDLERILDERKQLQAWIDRNYSGSWWKAAKATKIPPTNMAVYVGIKTERHDNACDLRKIKIVSKTRLYRATGLEFLNPMKSLPEGLNDWQVKLYAVMVKEEITPTGMARKLGVKPSTFHNYFDEPINLEHIRDGKLRNAIYKMIGQNPERAYAPQEAPAVKTPAPAAAPQTAAAEKPTLDTKVDLQLAAIAKILPCAFPNGSPQGIVDGTKQLVYFLNQNLERYGTNDAAQEILRKDRATLELFGRCHELLSAVYQNSPLTAHRLHTTYVPPEGRK